ncbi:MAG: sulfurtransferase TusA family protein [Myxococcaceae bacterium]|nr:sulfurtransferase TusA family protein [Myxococcaceae bacterium]
MSEPRVSPFEVDARGKACPMPVLMLAKALRAHPLVQLFADDPAARGDVLALCESAGHEVVQLTSAGRLLTAVVRRGR